MKPVFLTFNAIHNLVIGQSIFSIGRNYTEIIVLLLIKLTLKTGYFNNQSFD